MKFRKKPVVVNAVQWFKSGDHPQVKCLDDYRRTPVGPWAAEIAERYDNKDICTLCNNPRIKHGWIGTLEGGLMVCPGDWIIMGVKGEFYPCKPDIFKETYEPVEEN